MLFLPERQRCYRALSVVPNFRQSCTGVLQPSMPNWTQILFFPIQTKPYPEVGIIWQFLTCLFLVVSLVLLVVMRLFLGHSTNEKLPYYVGPSDGWAIVSSTALTTLTTFRIPFIPWLRTYFRSFPTLPRVTILKNRLSN